MGSILGGKLCLIRLPNDSHFYPSLWLLPFKFSAESVPQGIHQYKHSVVHLYRRLDSLRVFLSTNKLAVKKIIKKFNKNVKAPDRVCLGGPLRELSYLPRSGNKC